MLLLALTIGAVALAVACAAYTWRVARQEQQLSAARVTALAAAIEGIRPDDTAPASAMFDQSSGSMVQSRPLLKVAVGFAMAIVIIVLIAMSGERPQTTAAPAGPVQESVGGDSLELLSMRHERQANALTVTGLVRNPGAAAGGDIMAVVFAFDRDGSFVASGRAPLEFAAIASGDESPFRVVIPEVKEVGRYRVSFRTTAGVVRHVDRRPAGAASEPHLQASTQ